MLVRTMTTHQTRPPGEDDASSTSLLGNVELNAPQVRALRVAVVIMGVVIVLGLVVLIGRIIYLAARPSGQLVGAATTIAPDVSAALPAGAHVRSVSLHGDRLAIHYDAPAGSGITVVDLASGRTLSRVQLVPEAPKP